MMSKYSMSQWLPLVLSLLASALYSVLFLMFTDGNDNGLKGTAAFTLMNVVAFCLTYYTSSEFLVDMLNNERLEEAQNYRADKQVSDESFKALCNDRGWEYIPRLRGIITLDKSYASVRMACTKTCKPEWGDKFNKSKMYSELDQYWEMLEAQARLSA